MKKMKSILALTLSVLIMLALLGGCATPAKTEAPAAVPADSAAPTDTQAPAKTPAAETPKEPVTINFLNFSANRGDCVTTLDLMKALFEERHPDIKVNIETVGYNDYFTQLQTRLLGSDAPDCYELNFENFFPYQEQDMLMPLDDMMKASNFDSSIITEKALTAFGVDGAQYGLPYSFSTVVLVYNKDLFDKAGVAYPAENWTWKELDEAAAKIHEMDKKVFGIVQPVQFFEFFKISAQNGGTLINADKTAFTVNSPENVQAVQHLIDRIRVSNIAPSSRQSAGMEEWDWFKQGRTAMIITGIWSFPSFTTDCNFNWDIAVEPGSKQKATHFFANGLVVNKDSKYAQAAYEWISFISTSKEMANARVKSGWELPVTNYQEVLDLYAQQTPPGNRKAVFDSLNYVIPLPVIAQFNQMQDIINKELSAVETGAKTVQEALDAAQAELTANVKIK